MIKNKQTLHSDQNSTQLLERRVLVYEMRLHGYKLHEIADFMLEEHAELVPKGYCKSSVKKDLDAYHDDYILPNTFDKERIVNEELSRLDELQKVFFEKALNGNMFAFDKVIAIMDKRAKYLNLHTQTSPVEHKGLEGFIFKVVNGNNSNEVSTDSAEFSE